MFLTVAANRAGHIVRQDASPAQPLFLSWKGRGRGRDAADGRGNRATVFPLHHRLLRAEIQQPGDGAPKLEEVLLWHPSELPLQTGEGDRPDLLEVERSRLQET